MDIMTWSCHLWIFVGKVDKVDKVLAKHFFLPPFRIPFPGHFNGKLHDFVRCGCQDSSVGGLSQLDGGLQSWFFQGIGLRKTGAERLATIRGTNSQINNWMWLIIDISWVYPPILV
jgi:hypothetical protein